MNRKHSVLVPLLAAVFGASAPTALADVDLLTAWEAAQQQDPARERGRRPTPDRRAAARAARFRCPPSP